MAAAHRTFVALLVSLGLAACADSGEPPQNASQENTATSGMAATMDKARAVEDTTMQRKEDLDRALNAAESNH